MSGNGGSGKNSLNLEVKLPEQFLINSQEMRVMLEVKVNGKGDMVVHGNIEDPIFILDLIGRAQQVVASYLIKQRDSKVQIIKPKNFKV